MNFVELFWGVGRGQNCFFLMYLVIIKWKKENIFSSRSSKSRLFEQAQYRNEKDTHNPIKIIDITDNQINGRLDND